MGATPIDLMILYTEMLLNSAKQSQRNKSITVQKSCIIILKAWLLMEVGRINKEINLCILNYLTLAALPHFFIHGKCKVIFPCL